MNKKGFSNIALLIILVFVAVIGVVSYFVVAQKSNNTPTPPNNSASENPPNPPANIQQLTKEQVLNGFDPCGQQFKNGEIDNGWEKYTQLEKTCSQAQSYIGLNADGIVFADLDSNGVMEALVSARVVRASSGGVLYVFKNDNGTARVIDTISFGKNNVEVVSANKDIVVVQPYITKPIELDPNTPPRETYKFIDGKLIKQ